MNTNQWYRLDNAAKIFPTISRIENSAAYRLAVTLTEEIDPDFLQEAVDQTLTRYPTLAVWLRRGYFWYFFENNENQLLIEKESRTPCGHIDPIFNNGYLMKVFYYGKRISVETHHSLSDGSGAIEFIKTLTYTYLKRSGKDVDPGDEILLPNEIPSRYEMEDSFHKYYQPCERQAKKEEDAFMIQGTVFKPFGNHVDTGVVDVQEIRKIAKDHGVTITTFLVARLIRSIYEESMQYGLYKEPIKIAVPVNLRSIFPSKTLRNFFSVVHVVVRPDDSMEFKDILQSVQRQLIEKTKKDSLYPKIADHVESERFFLSRFIPLGLKNMILRFAYRRYGTKVKTATISNLGQINFPDSVSKWLDRMEFVFYPSTGSPLNLGICSVNGKMSISISRCIVEPGITKKFFRSLVKEDGVHVKLYSNEWEAFHENL